MEEQQSSKPLFSLSSVYSDYRRDFIWFLEMWVSAALPPLLGDPTGFWPESREALDGDPKSPASILLSPPGIFEDI